MLVDKSVLALDCETTGLDLRHGCMPFLIATCNLNGVTCCWEWDVDPQTRKPKIPPGDIEGIKKRIKGKTLVFHNAKFDLRALSLIGITVNLIDGWTNGDPLSSTPCLEIHDTLLMSHALSSEGPHGLKHLAKELLSIDDNDEKILRSKTIHACRYLERSLEGKFKRGHNLSGDREVESDYWTVRLADDKDDACLTYAKKDVERTILLYDFFSRIFKAKPKLKPNYKRELSLLKTVYKVETDGICVDSMLIANKKKKLHRAKIDKEALCQAAMSKALRRNCNVRSPIDLREYLYSSKGLKLPVTAVTLTGHNSCAKKTLEELAIWKDTLKPEALEFIPNLLLLKSYSTASGYLSNYQDRMAFLNGEYVLYPSLNQTGTKTTRFSSNNPNGQNVSTVSTIEIWGEDYPGPELRECFRPPSGKVWYSIDYSQLELRVFAAASQEKSIIEALEDGYDFHMFVACKIFNKKQEHITKAERRIAKNVNFAIIFGAKEKKVNATAGIPNAYKLFASQFPNVASFMGKTVEFAKKNGCIYTLDGYKLDVPQDGLFKSVNYLVQGTAGSIIKNAMIEIDKQKLVDWKESRIVLQIHDELLFEFSRESRNKNLREVRKIASVMEKSGSDLAITTPVSVDEITANWGHSKKIVL